MNTEADYRKILRCGDEDLIKNFGRYLDKVKYKWFNKTNVNM
jgi:hypothetical protein